MDAPLPGWQHTVSAHEHVLAFVVFGLNLVGGGNCLHEIYHPSKDDGQTRIRARNYYADETQCGSILKDALTKFLRDLAEVTRQAARASRRSTISIRNCRRDVAGPRACERRNLEITMEGKKGDDASGCFSSMIWDTVK
ncbi:hypothetical protein ARMGADRAFT_1074991 [Armillaria gallica]|uniref:Uncharacterized protein n=1 Tax=Armillaria gallica TaxID=47427 RepID=A0A2H3DSC6_ARMGA|nr:hypothetical protein ARMGADRAFT_1074991 [Armillaria gallica]